MEEFKGRPEPEERRSKMPSRKKIEAAAAPMSGVTLYVGCVPIKRDTPGAYLTLDAVFVEVLKYQEKTITDYAGSNAFDRRDDILGSLGPWLAGREGPIHILAPSVMAQCPDEKNLVFAVRLYASGVVESTT